MRWPQLGRSRRREEQPAGENTPPAGRSSTPSDGPTDQPTGQQSWSALPPIRPTWGGSAPLTTHADDLVRAPLTSSFAPQRPRRVTSRPLNVHENGDDGTPDPGTVIGLASARPLPTAPIVAVPAQFPDQPPLRHATARPLVEHAPLTRATDSYVGEPIAPPVAPPPQPAPAPARPSRSSDPAVEARTDAGARFQEALANLHKSGLPRYVSPSESAPVAEQSWQRPEPAVPGPATAPPPPVTPPPPSAEVPRLTHRRNTLAQSRRLGLGAPVQRDGSDDEDGGDGGTDSEPAPAPSFSAPPPAPPLPPPAPAASVEARPVAPEPAAEPAPAAEPSSPRPGGASAPRAADEPRPALEPVVVPALPITDTSAHPRAATAPLVFRGRPARPDLRETTRRVAERAVVTRPPAELAQALRSSHGIDVGDVPVHRDTAADNEARDRRARAFTRGGRVFLPEAAGPVTSARARGLLAHELVHAAQQRRLGTALPAEDTPLGRRLEAEAVQAELMYTSPAHFDEPELVHTAPPVSAAWVDNRITQHAGPPIDYLADNAELSSQQQSEFEAAAQQAVQQVLDDYTRRTGHDPRQSSSSNSASGPFASLSEEQVAEQQFLDVINTVLEQRGEARQAALTEEDRAKVRNMLGGGGAGGGLVQEQASARTRWEEQYLGGSTALGADFGGLSMFTSWGRPDHPSNTANNAGNNAGQGGGSAAGTGGRGTAGGLNRSGGSSRTSSGYGSNTQNTGPNYQENAFTRAQESVFGDGGGYALGGDLGGFASWFTHRDPQQVAAHRPGAAAGPAGAGHADATHAPAHGAAGEHAAGHHPGEHGPRDVDVDDLDMDELANRLFDKLRTRLRREFLIDRERAGLLTDFR